MGLQMGVWCWWGLRGRGGCLEAGLAVLQLSGCSLWSGWAYGMRRWCVGVTSKRLQGCLEQRAEAECSVAANEGRGIGRQRVCRRRLGLG